MKSELKDTIEIKYPCLMQDTESGMIVLMRIAGYGTVVHAGKTCTPLGYYCKWEMESFHTFTGSVTLSND